MKRSPNPLTSIALLALVAGCATQAPPPESATPLAASAAPAGSQRLPGSLTCESEVSCSACADDHDRELVRFTFLIHATEVRACLARVGATDAGTKIVRLAIDPTGAIRTSCIVRPTLNDTAVDHCLTDLALTWKVNAPASGAWALVDYAYTLPKTSAQ
ncbi:MAG TPA: hypothetical protein VH560_06125 [Polyangia bacterium]|jgi:hypothetical protein|nr:hypothetical protein [Polyangia bacterium]